MEGHHITGVRGFITLLVAVCFPFTAHALTDTNTARLAVDIDCEIGSVDFSDSEPISIGASKPAAMQVFAFAETNRAGIDALMVYSNLLIFSLDTDCTIGGVEYADEDLVSFDPLTTTYDMYFDGSAYGIPEGVNLDAACFWIGTTSFFISVDTGMYLTNGTYVYDEDILLVSSNSIRLDSRGSALDIPARADVDGLYWDGRYLFYSLDVTATIDGETGDDHDVWVYDGLGGTTRVITNLDIASRVDIQALDEPVDTDGDWLTDWEEATGFDEAASTYYGIAFPLDPEGNTSDPAVADTDGDGFSDGIEAACGTLPRNSNDYLRVTAIAHRGGGEVVTWASASNRVYDLEGAESLTSDTGTTIADDYDSAGMQTSYTNDSGTDVYFYRVKLEPGL